MKSQDILKQIWLKSLLLSLFLVLTIVMLDAKSLAQDARRVIFSKGKSQIEFVGTAKIGKQKAYSIRLKKKQICQIEVEWQGKDIGEEGQGLSGYMIIYPNGKTIEDPQDSYLKAEIAGDYKIIIAPKTKKTNYRYRLIFIKN